MGDPATKVDFLIMGDGYTAREVKKFEADAISIERNNLKIFIASA
jgi:hypothetical protein